MNYFSSIRSLVLKTEIEAVRRDIETPRRKAILLIAGYRGGSTLTGEVFNRNPNVLYYFGRKFNGLES